MCSALRGLSPCESAPFIVQCLPCAQRNYSSCTHSANLGPQLALPNYWKFTCCFAFELTEVEHILHLMNWHTLKAVTYKGKETMVCGYILLLVAVCLYRMSASQEWNTLKVFGDSYHGDALCDVILTGKSWNQKEGIEDEHVHDTNNRNFGCVSMTQLPPASSQKEIPSKILLNKLNFNFGRQINNAEIGDEFIRDLQLIRNLDWAYTYIYIYIFE